MYAGEIFAKVNFNDLKIGTFYLTYLMIFFNFIDFIKNIYL